MQLNLQGKHVLITGGSRGIGLACAISFANEGAAVTIVGSSQLSVERAKQRLESMGITVSGLSFKLDQREDQIQFATHLDDVDVLVNNAGAIPGGGLDALSDEQWRQAWDLKVHGYIDATRIALGKMLQRNSGVIVNVIGIAGVAPRYDYICGSAGNAALIAFTQAAGAQAAKQGVRVLGVNPGATETDRVMTLYKARAKQRFGDESRWQELLQGLPFGRLAKAEEIADLVVFLASARASYLSGVVIDADGGARHSSV